MTAEQVDIQRAIRAKHAEFARHFGAGDAFRLVDAFYAQEACVQPANAPPILGRAGIRTLFAALLGGSPMTLAYESEHVESSGDLAYATGAYRLTARPPGGEPTRDTGHYLEVFRRQADGAWRCVADMVGSDHAPR